MLALVAVAAISTSGTVAPRVEIYTRTICRDFGLDEGYEQCRADPKVQASAAQLMAVISALSGLLSTVSAAWWGSVSSWPCVISSGPGRPTLTGDLLRSCRTTMGGCGC